MKATKIDELSAVKIEPALVKIVCVNRIIIKQPEKRGKFETITAINVAFRDLGFTKIYKNLITL